MHLLIEIDNHSLFLFKFKLNLPFHQENLDKNFIGFGNWETQVHNLKISLFFMYPTFAGRHKNLFNFLLISFLSELLKSNLNQKYELFNILFMHHISLRMDLLPLME